MKDYILYFVTIDGDGLDSTACFFLVSELPTFAYHPKHRSVSLYAARGVVYATSSAYPLLSDCNRRFAIGESNVWNCRSVGGK